jgi:Vitamin K-dependent gamma-carboxylase
MSAPQHAAARLGAILDGWRTFWFRPEPAYTLGLVRIAFGVVSVAWTLVLLPDVIDLFGVQGAMPLSPPQPYQWGLFAVWPSDQALIIGWALLLVSSIAVTIGWHSRLASLMVFVLIVSFLQRNPDIFNGGDVVIRVEAFYLALSPSGAALSLDQRRRTGSFWSAQCRAPWPLRLMQIQLSLIYVMTVLAKLEGSTWLDGTAVSYSLQNEEYRFVPVPQWIATDPLLTNVATWGTLVVELAIGILVWNRRLRPWVLGAGVVLHLSISMTLAVGFFSVAMFVLYLAFVPPEAVERLPDKLTQLATKSLASVRRYRPSGSPTGLPSNQTPAPEPPRHGTVSTAPMIIKGGNGVDSRTTLAEEFDGHVPNLRPQPEPGSAHPADASTQS